MKKLIRMNKISKKIYSEFSVSSAVYKLIRSTEITSENRQMIKKVFGKRVNDLYLYASKYLLVI